MRPLVLASSSIYRRQLLERLGLPFVWHDPNIDEQPLKDEDAQLMVQRLALNKACALRARFTQHLIIGSDQAAVLDGKILGKPGNSAAAEQQLAVASGRSVVFYTGLCLLNSQSGDYQLQCETFTVHFRQLSDDQIARYVALEQPLDCAGSFKAEGLGVCLFRATQGRDATSLVGLPLIALCDMLNQAGISLP